MTASTRQGDIYKYHPKYPPNIPRKYPPSAANTPRNSEAPKMPINEAIPEQRGS
jgi:hypothetical protein